MGKAKRQKAKRHATTPYNKPAPQALSQTKKSGQPQKPSGNAIAKQPAPQAQRQPILFRPADKILLVGEGDFSFSASLLSEHGCTSLTATTLESREDLLSKYPQASDHLATLEDQTVLFTVDATKLGLPHVPGAAQLRKAPGFDVVVFNFPHVGGKSTDVNRQVRANQWLVVKFLEGAKRILKPGGAVVVTIFEGQPYELWGLRNLARHVGLQVERSMKFDASQYPGYQHARTLGNVERGWKGGDRPARMYILRKQGESQATSSSKKARADSSDDDSD